MRNWYSYLLGLGIFIVYDFELGYIIMEDSKNDR